MSLIWKRCLYLGGWDRGRKERTSPLVWEMKKLYNNPKPGADSSNWVRGFKNVKQRFFMPTPSKKAKKVPNYDVHAKHHSCQTTLMPTSNLAILSGTHALTLRLSTRTSVRRWSRGPKEVSRLNKHWGRHVLSFFARAMTTKDHELHYH